MPDDPEEWVDWDALGRRIKRRALSYPMRLRVISKVFESTCHDKWYVAVDALGPAVTNALWMILTPSPDEILEEFLHPKLGRSRGRFGALGGRRAYDGKAGGWRRTFQKIFPDVDEVIAKRLPGRSLFAARQAAGLERFFWLGIDVLDRLLWQYLLFEIGDQGTLIWASNLMESRFCAHAYDGAFGWRSSGNEWTGTDAWRTGIGFEFSPVHGVWYQDNGRGGAATGFFSETDIWWELKFTQVADSIALRTSRPFYESTALVEVGRGGGVWETVYSGTKRVTGEGSVTHNICIPAGKVYQWRLRWTSIDGWEDVEEGYYPELHHIEKSTQGVIFGTK